MANLIMFVEGIKHCINGVDIDGIEDKDFIEGYEIQYQFEQILTNRTGCQ